MAILVRLVLSVTVIVDTPVAGATNCQVSVLHVPFVAVNPAALDIETPPQVMELTDPAANTDTSTMPSRLALFATDGELKL